MARPQKMTVDYFPHFVNHGKTLLILQNELGNDGYAFWFKLLSLLCKTDGQVYDYNNPASWRLLLAETHVSEDIANKALQLLAEIDAIDKELYLSKVIWVQHLIDNLADVYRRRQNGSTPKRPVNVSNNPVNASNKPQTKQDKTKQDKTIKGAEIPDFIDKTTWEAFLEMRKKKKTPPTGRGQQLLIKKLEELKVAGDDPNEVLNQSIMNNWTGLYPLKKEEVAYGSPRGFTTSGANRGNIKKSSTKLPDRDTGYTEPPPDPELLALVETNRRRGEVAQRESGTHL